MARVFLTIKALMQMCFNEEVDTRVPKEYFKIKERLLRLDEGWDAMLRQNLTASQYRPKL